MNGTMPHTKDLELRWYRHKRYFSGEHPYRVLVEVYNKRDGHRINGYLSFIIPRERQGKEQRETFKREVIERRRGYFQRVLDYMQTVLDEGREIHMMDWPPAISEEELVGNERDERGQRPGHTGKPQDGDDTADRREGK